MHVEYYPKIIIFLTPSYANLTTFKENSQLKVDDICIVCPQMKLVQAKILGVFMELL